MRILIQNATVITVDVQRRVLAPGHVVISGGRIESVGEGEPPAGPFHRTINADGMILTPGLLNLHQHLHMHLLKGMADGMLLEPWVFKLATPFRNHLNADALELATQVGALEMLRTGTTCFFNHQGDFDIPNYRELAMDAVARVGLRQVLALSFQCRTPGMPDHPLSASQARSGLARYVRAHQGTHGGLTRLGLTIECNAHHTELGRSSDELVREGHALAHELDLRVASHMSGGTLSMSMGFTKYRRQTGRSDVAYLKQLGVLDGRWLLKHGIHFTDEDIEAVRVAGSSVVYTPTSEAIRGGGLGPFGRMRALGVRCGLGSDGPAVDYSVDMVEQMRACCYLQAVRYGDAGAIKPHAALEMATIDAARALGLENEIGSIEPGKQADLVLFDLPAAHCQAIADPVQRLVWTGRGSDAHTVFVQGAELLSCGRFTAWPNWREMLEKARQMARQVTARAGLAARAEPVWPMRGIRNEDAAPGRSEHP